MPELRKNSILDRAFSAIELHISEGKMPALPEKNISFLPRNRGSVAISCFSRLLSARSKCGVGFLVCLAFFFTDCKC